MVSKPRAAIPTAARPADAKAVFAGDVVAGLSQPRKTLPCQYFYDTRGSALFEDITGLPEYYPTVTETAILRRYVTEIAGSNGDETLLIEFGSGSSTKTELLIDALPGLRCYMPIDVSASALDQAAGRLRERYPQLDVRPVVGDFTGTTAIPTDLEGRRRLGFFPGSTIGNFAPPQALDLLAAFRATLGAGSRLIIGVDLRKDVRTLLQAYDDAQGVTAAFNINLLVRINRELGGTFDLTGFRHKARYDLERGRIEMHLVSMRDQTASVCGHTFTFRVHETIHTENSYKFTIAQFQALASEAGWTPRQVWTDPKDLFSIHDLAAL